MSDKWWIRLAALLSSFWVAVFVTSTGLVFPIGLIAGAAWIIYWFSMTRDYE